LWKDYLDPAYRDRAPKLVIDSDGKERLLVEEQVLGSQQGMGGIGGVGARRGVVSSYDRRVEWFQRSCRAGRTPRQRGREMRSDATADDGGGTP